MEHGKIVMKTKSRIIRKRFGRFYIVCLLLALPHLVFFERAFADSGQKADSLDIKVPLDKVIDIGGEYGRYTNGYGETNAQFLRFSLSKPYAYTWRIETGRAERFGDRGFGFGTSYTRYLPDGLSFMLGFSTGTGDFIFPEYRVDLGIGRAFLAKDNLLATFGYFRSQSKVENRSDGIGLELTWYTSDHWILGAVGRHEIGQPGDTKSTAGGFSITYMIYRKFYLGIGAEYGDVSYIIVGPSSSLVDYKSAAYKLYWTQYVTPSAGFNLRLDYEDTTFYELRGVSFGIFKEW